ncbi:MAG: hypothetical protein WDM90_01860 [Ferruginibacter sp.]
MYNLKKQSVLLIAAAAVLIFSACSSNEIGDSKDVSQDKIYQSYDVSYSEGSANAEVYCQFRFAGKNGTTLVLNKPSKIEVDGEEVKVDSSKYGGAYYQVDKPAGNFFGKHSLAFTSINDKKLTNTFSFDKFKLVNVPASVSKKQSFDLNFETTPLGADDYIEVGTTSADSSFSVTHNGSEKGNAITIPQKELQRQKVKEITLEATLYRKIALQENTTEGGKISINIL